jgi:hypothetical protein
MTKLAHVADIIRSKNAGPYSITFDILFFRRDKFVMVRDSGVLSAALFARLYGYPEQECEFTVMDQACGFKFTVPRAIASGDAGDSDCFGSQQHANLLDIEVPSSSGEIPHQ